MADFERGAIPNFLPRRGRLILDAAVDDRGVGGGRGGLFDQFLDRLFGARAHELVRDDPQERFGVARERVATTEGPVDFGDNGHQGVVLRVRRFTAPERPRRTVRREWGKNERYQRAPKSA